MSLGTMADWAGKKKASARPKSRAKRVEHPQLDDASEGDGGERGDEQHTGGVRSEHQHPRRQPVGERAADQHEERPGNGRQGENRAHREGVAGEL